MWLVATLWVLNVILVVDWALNRRAPFWLVALILLGPLGALAYLITFYEQITFPVPIAQTVRTITGKKRLKECPRCGMVTQVKPHQDGRQLHYMCDLCAERTFHPDSQSEEIVRAAAEIVRQTEQTPRLWGVKVSEVRLPEEVQEASTRLLEIEKRYGADQDVSPSLKRFLLLEGDRPFPRPLEDEHHYQELYDYFRLALDGDVSRWHWGDAWNADKMREHISIMETDATRRWLRRKLVRDFGERGSDDLLKSTQAARDARKDRDDCMDCFMNFLADRFEGETTLYFVNDCDDENLAEAVHLLVNGSTALAWVTYWAL